MPRSYQNKDADASLWKAYEDSGKDEAIIYADAIQDRINKERTLKGVLEFASKSTRLACASSVVETWCEKHNSALENMGLQEVVRTIKIKPPQIQATVLAYFLIAVGMQTCWSWSIIERKKLFVQFPMMDVYNKMVALGVGQAFTNDVLTAVNICNHLQLTAG